ncbi:hypothetical protein [Planctomonas deserti]|uniref:hypothetical protein n=1 Tax=Planctomonas deserti TaxID=2144185 RepID=UPI000D360481|nr:hypothetical protein [Planctomonas deserti]
MSGSAGDRRAAADLLARIERDPEAGTRAERAYRGRHDLRDALWWAAHPGTTSPSGAPDPALELRRLRSAAFSREGQESEWVDAALPSGGTGRVRRAEALALECEAGLERDRADLRAALAAVAGGRTDAATDRGIGRGIGRGIDAFAEDATGQEDAAAAASPTGFGVSMGAAASGPVERRGRATRWASGRFDRRPPADPARKDSGDSTGDDADARESDAAGAPEDETVADVPRGAAVLRSVLLRRPVAATATLALVGVLAGAGVTWATLNGAARPSLTSTPASRSIVDAPSWDDTPSQASPPALEVFNRDATAEDALPPQFFLDSPAATARILYTNGPLRVWGFLDRGQVCMFVREGEAASGTCVARDSFGYAGITLMLSADGTTMPEPATGVAAAAITDLTWTPEGEIQIRSAPLDHDTAG